MRYMLRKVAHKQCPQTSLIPVLRNSISNKKIQNRRQANKKNYKTLGRQETTKREEADWKLQKTKRRTENYKIRRGGQETTKRENVNYK